MKRTSRSAVALLGVIALCGCGADYSDPAEGNGGAGGAGGATGGAGGAGGATGGTGGAWGCVGHVQYPPAPAPTLDIWMRFFHFSKTYGDPGNYGPFKGAKVDACAKDSDCSAPASSSVTNAQGDAALTLPTLGAGFEGYLRVHGEDIVTLDIHMLPPIADATSRFLDADTKPVVLLASPWANFTQAVGGTAPDPAKGHVIATTLDCSGAFTPDVKVTVNGIEAHLAADEDSVFFNVAPGPVDVVGKLGDGTQVAHLTRTVVAGRILALNFGPTPTP